MSILTLLLDNGANPNILDKDKFSPLGLAIREENFKASYKLLKDDRINVKDGAGLFSGILHLAVGKLEGFIVERCL